MGVSRFENTRLELARLSVEGRVELTRGLAAAAEATAHSASVARVGVWFFSPDHSELCCTTLYDSTTKEHGAGAVLPLSQLPHYHAALLSRRVIAADDARAMEETRELTASYLVPNQIVSMLDAPIFRAGEVVGVVCLEHVGAPRAFSKREQDLAASVADVIAVLLEQAARVDAEALLRAQHETLAKAERLEALMRFSGGVAHDFNNVLATIVLQVSGLEGPRSQTELAQTADDIREAAEVGRRIVKQLLTFGRHQPGEPREIDLSRAVAELRSFLSSALGDRHRLVVVPLPPRLIVHADATQIDQLLLNLVVNARDAMPDGGDVTITLEATPEWARLSVKDTGVGIEESMLDKIFEPFFTTKGHGTGLGLSTSYSIVHEHHGKIEVVSKQGEGTTFVVWLPRTG